MKATPRVIVLAKAPQAGRSKTRLCPPCTPAEAAAIAYAALHDTCLVVAAVAGVTPVVVLDGPVGAWLPPGLAVVPQRDGDLGARLAGAFDDVGGPALLVGMDTPQITPPLLRSGLAELAHPSTDVVVGPAADGGFWAVGFRRAVKGAFDGVPMSTSDTCAHLRRRLAHLGLRTRELPTLRDVDTIDDARAVAGLIPASHFGRALRAVDATVGVP